MIGDDGVTVRASRPGDATAIGRLLGELGYPQDDVAALGHRIRAWSADPAAAVHVAEAAERLLGVVAVHVSPFFERPGSWARIVALVVSEHSRGAGVGARLVAAAESFAVGRGCLRMEVTSADRRREAHAFYRSRGYVDQQGASTRFLRELS